MFWNIWNIYGGFTLLLLLRLLCIFGGRNYHDTRSYHSMFQINHFNLNLIKHRSISLAVNDKVSDNWTPKWNFLVKKLLPDTQKNCFLCKKRQTPPMWQIKHYSCHHVFWNCKWDASLRRLENFELQYRTIRALSGKDYQKLGKRFLDLGLCCVYYRTSFQHRHQFCQSGIH